MQSRKVLKGWYALTYKDKSAEVKRIGGLWFLEVGGNRSDDFYYYKKTALKAFKEGVDEGIF